MPSLPLGNLLPTAVRPLGFGDHGASEWCNDGRRSSVVLVAVLAVTFPFGLGALFLLSSRP